MQPSASRHMFLLLAIFVACTLSNPFPQSSPGNDGGHDSSIIENTNSTDLSDTLSVGSHPSLKYEFKPQLGQLKGIPLFITTINCLCHIALGEYDSFQATRTYTYQPYEKDVSITVDGQWGRKPGNPGKPGKWRAKNVMGSILELVRQMAIQKKLEGVVGEVSLVPGNKLEAKIIFQDPSLQNSLSSNNSATLLPMDDSLQEANITLALAETDTTTDTTLEDDIAGYRSWERIDTTAIPSLPVLNETELSAGVPEQLGFYVKFHGPEILAPDWFIAVAEGITAYANGAGNTMAPEINKDIAGFTTNLQMGQYSKLPPLQRSRVMTRLQAIRGLLVWPPYALSNRKFQESTMVIENARKQAIGVFKITRRDSPSTDIAAVEIS